MAHKKSAAVLDSSPTGSEDDRLDQPTSTVDTLAQEVRVLREAVDELRELLDWTMRNREAPAGNHPFLPISSLPRDPIAQDFGGNINCTNPDDLRAAETATTAANKGELF